MVGDVDNLALHVESGRPQASGFVGDAPCVEVEQSDTSAICGERLDETQSQAASAARDDHAESLYLEQLGDLHARFLAALSMHQPGRVLPSPLIESACPQDRSRCG